MKIWVAQYSPRTKYEKSSPIGKMDIFAKLDNLRDKIEVAYTHFGVRYEFNAAIDLMIFTAPEWYFRSVDRGVESLYEKYKRDWFFLEVQKISENYPSLLIIPGSCYYGIKDDDDKSTYVYNCTAAISEGKILTVIHKWMEADKLEIDEKWGMYKGIENCDSIEEYMVFLKENYSCINDGIKLGVPKENHDNTGIFGFKNITFGLDICRDHVAGRLKRVIGYDPDKRVDIYVTIANDTKFKTNYEIQKKGGYHLFLDGKLAGNADIFECSEIQKCNDPYNNDNKDKNINIYFGADKYEFVLITEGTRTITSFNHLQKSNTDGVVFCKSPLRIKKHESISETTEDICVLM